MRVLLRKHSMVVERWYNNDYGLAEFEQAMDSFGAALRKESGDDNDCNRIEVSKNNLLDAREGFARSS